MSGWQGWGAGRELTTVAMGGIRAQADITGHQQAGEGLSHQADSFNGRGVLGVSARAPLILGVEQARPRVLHKAFMKAQQADNGEGHRGCSLHFHQHHPGRKHGQLAPRVEETEKKPDLLSPGGTALIGFLAHHGCCLQGGNHAHSSVALGPAQGESQCGQCGSSKRSCPASLLDTSSPGIFTLGTLLGTPKIRMQRRPSSTRGLSISSSRFTPYLGREPGQRLKAGRPRARPPAPSPSARCFC